LLRALREQRNLTRPEMLDRLERRARELREGSFALTERQLARLETGQVKTAPRVVTTRVIEAEFCRPISDLLSVADPSSPGVASPAPTALDAGPLDHWTVIIGELAQLDHRQGPSDVLEPARSVYASLIHAAEDGRCTDRPHYVRLAARCAELIGWFCQDSARLDEADAWTARSFDLAEAVEACELGAYVLMRRSAIAVERGKAGDALLLAERALRRSSSGHDRALALREVAAAHALNRNVPAFRGAVDMALGQAAAGVGRSPLTTYCSIPYLWSEAGAAALAAGEPGLATEYLRQALDEWEDGQPRDLAVCRARLALAHAHGDDPEQVVTVAVEVLRDPTAKPSPRAVASLHQALRVLERRGAASHPDLDQVRGELSTVG
jgi:transcriptional regulator with XRE-family HTH domain